MLALVVLSTAILGTAAAQASAWRVLAGSRGDTDAWAALHTQAETLIAEGYDQVSDGSRTLSGQTLQWSVVGLNPKVVTLSAQRTNMAYQISDTVRIVLAR